MNHQKSWLRLAPALLLSLALAGCFPFQSGQQNQLIKTDATYSPDGTKIAFISNQDGDFEIYVMNVASSKVTKLTDNTAGEAAPSWSPDGKRIAFASSRTGNWELYTMNADGSQQEMLKVDLK